VLVLHRKRLVLHTFRPKQPATSENLEPGLPDADSLQQGGREGGREGKTGGDSARQSQVVARTRVDPVALLGTDPHRTLRCSRRAGMSA